MDPGSLLNVPSRSGKRSLLLNGKDAYWNCNSEIFFSTSDDFFCHLILLEYSTCLSFIVSCKVRFIFLEASKHFSLSIYEKAFGFFDYKLNRLMFKFLGKFVWLLRLKLPGRFQRCILLSKHFCLPWLFEELFYGPNDIIFLRSEPNLKKIENIRTSTFSIDIGAHISCKFNLNTVTLMCNCMPLDERKFYVSK